GWAEDRQLFRILTPIAKCWITARARTVTSEAMNVRGGNGYIEEWVNARLVRDAYLGSIWEGATPIVALDVQRAIVREGCHEPLFAAIGGRVPPGAGPAAPAPGRPPLPAPAPLARPRPPPAPPA